MLLRYKDYRSSIVFMFEIYLIVNEVGEGVTDLIHKHGLDFRFSLLGSCGNIIISTMYRPHDVRFT
jgi:hypothetical protein